MDILGYEEFLLEVVLGDGLFVINVQTKVLSNPHLVLIVGHQSYTCSFWLAEEDGEAAWLCQFSSIGKEPMQPC
jgi:hypothetical protein